MTTQKKKAKPKFKVGDVIFMGRSQRFTITAIKKDRYIVDNSDQYLLFINQTHWGIDIEQTARNKFDDQLKELLK